MSDLDELTEQFKKKAALSFRMEEELYEITAYMKICGTTPDLSEWDDVSHLDKTQTKKAIDAIRTQAVLKTPSSFGKNPGKASDMSGDACGSFEDNGKKAIIAYVEEDIKDDPLSRELVKCADEVVYIKHYKDIFNGKGHRFKEEKKSGSFIVAKNRDRLVYPGAPFCQSFGNEHFYYASCVKNCIYDCDYCFLQGLYPCGYPVFFVNLSDYFDELEKILKEHDAYVCISYDTDLLALEPRIHYVEKWIRFALLHENLKIEVRTKSGNPAPFNLFGKILKESGNERADNVVFAWTVTPPEVSEFAEIRLPSSEKRIDAMLSAKKAGFPIRMCFDPIIYHGDYEEHYRNFFSYVFSRIEPCDVLDASVGVFRISHNLLKKMRDANPDSIVTRFPYVTENGACHYGELTDKIIGFAKTELQKYMPGEKIFGWDNE